MHVESTGMYALPILNWLSFLEFVVIFLCSAGRYVCNNSAVYKESERMDGARYDG